MLKNLTIPRKARRQFAHRHRSRQRDRPISTTVIRIQTPGDTNSASKRRTSPGSESTGLRFSLALPVKKARGLLCPDRSQRHRVRKMGSAYQYIEIPDLRKTDCRYQYLCREAGRRFAVGRFRIPGEFRNAPLSRRAAGPRKSPALRNYQPGENVECAAVIYKR